MADPRRAAQRNRRRWRSTRCATNKMRSALTVLGVVIGITSIVGMTSLIRGFDESLRDSIRAARPEHDLRAEVQRRQLRVGQDVPRGRSSGRTSPCEDARAIARESPVGRRRRRLARRRPATARRGVLSTATRRTKQLAILGATRELRRGQLRQARARAGCSPPAEVEHRRQRRRARADARASRSSRTPIRSARRCASAPTSSPSSACFGKRPSPGGFAPAPTTSRSSRTPRTRSSTARCRRLAIHRRQLQPRRVPDAR